MFNYDHIIKVLNGSIGALTVFRLQRKAVFLLMFLLLFSFTATGSAAPSLNNGGFETPDVSGWEAQPSGSGWSAENNGFKIADSGSAYGNTAYAGSQNAILQGAVWISQSVSGFEVGKKYTVSWAEADRATPYGQNNFNVSLGGTVVATAHIAASTSWEVKTSSEFTATSTTHTLQFEAFNTGGGDKSVFIDSISIEVIESNEPPGKASNPSPADDATSVGLDSDLSWTGGDDSNSSDVYFGTDSTPDSGEFEGNQSGTSFDPGSLDPNTTYYWRIDEINAYGTTTGDVWSFTTTGNDLGWYAPDTGADFSYTSGESANWTFTNYSPFDPQLANDTVFDSTEVKYVAFWTKMTNTPSSVYFCGFSFLDGVGTYVKTPDVAETVTGDWQMVKIDLSDKQSGTGTYTGDRTFRIDLQQSSYSALSSATIEIDWISLTNSNTWDGYTRDSTDYVWDFSSTPDVAKNPVPEDQGTGVSLDIVLKWWPGQNATSRDVYFGTDSTPDSGEFEGNQSAISFDPGSLDPNTTYYWRIDEVEGGSTTTGDVWSFTTTGNNLGWYATDTGADFSYTSGESANWTFTDYSPFDPVIANDTVFDSTEVKYVAFWTKMTNAPSSVYFCGFSFLDGVGTYVKTPDVAETVTGDWQMVKIDLSDKQSGTGTYTGDRTFRIDLQQSSYSALSSATIEIDWISLTNSNTWDGYTRDSTDLVWDFSSTPDVAKNPVPDDQETDVSLDIVLKWWPGKDANSRDVYFGTDSTPDSGEFQGNQTALSFDPGTLDPSTTYYWRIDEKTATSTTTGDVWSFTTTGDDLGWYAPEDTGADFSYSSGESANWTFTNYSPFDPQIENDTEFDSSEVKYVAFWARMSNTPSSLYFCGFSFGSGGYVKTPDVAETVTGDWQMVRIDLSDKYSGTDTYTGDRTFRIDLQQSSYSALSSATIEIDWISLTNSSTWDGYTRNSTDLVWDFSSTPDAASHPYPEDEAVYVENDEVLEWWPGKDATSRDVYFGTDPTPDSSEFQGNQSATSFDPNTLDYDTTYYWRVDEKTASSTTTGDVWRFTTEPIPPNNPVLNPGFESPDVSGYEYRPSGSNWSGVNGFVIADDGSAFNNTAYEGNQNACLQNVSSCSQAVSGLEVGKSYTVSWVEASRPSAGGNNFRVLIDGSVVASLHTVTDTDWVEKTSESFVATSTTQTLKFDALGGAGGDRTVFLDSISIDRCYDCGIGWSITFPGSTWDSMSPASLGLNQTKLDQFANNIGGQGIIVRQGYVVKTWGTTSYKSDWASAAKPVISTMLFFAIEEDKLDDVDELIEDHGWNLISKDETMTFRHLANMVSGYARGEVPGARWAYNDYAIQLYAETLFDNVYETSANAAATNSNRLGALDFQDGSIFSSRDGYGLSTSVRDAARIGWLWCNYGYWDGEQLLPRSYFENYMKAQVSSSTPRTSSGGSDYLGVGTFGGGSDQTGDGPGVYGFNWWCNPNQSNWPDAPADTVQANGHWGMEVITVIPSLSLVVAYKGGNTRGHSTGSSSSAMNQDLKLLTEACPEFPVGSIMVDPTESSRMVYHATYENGHLKPVCFAGPGDPEDFFYNDTQDNLDLLTSRGARCTYITAVLKDFGGGNPGTGSALDSKLTEWEGYITDLEDAGVITVFFFFDDDQARTSNWQELVDKCVAKFKHHKLLIWSVAEEYAEAMTSSQVAEVAARIKDKDEYNHVVGVHQNHGNSFNFASNPNLDMFLMQLNETSASALHSGVKNSNVNGNKILNMAEAEDHAKKDRTTVRKWNWACIMGGASAVQVIWMGRDSDPSDWNTVDKYNDCARLTEFMESTRVNDTVCNDSLAYGNTDYVLADAGNAYILYGDSGTSLGGNISAGTYSVTWFDCIDGDLVENGNSALSSGNQNFTKPGSIGNEAVCYLERQ